MAGESGLRIGLPVYMLGAHSAARKAACIAMLIGLDTFRATGVPLNEGGTNHPIDHVGAAFYVWELSFLVLALTAWHFQLRQVTHRPPPVPRPG